MCRSRVNDIVGLLALLLLGAAGGAQPAEGQACGFVDSHGHVVQLGIGTASLLDVVRSLGTSGGLEVESDWEEGVGPVDPVLVLRYDLRFAVQRPQPATATFVLARDSCRVDSVYLDFRRFGPHAGESLVAVSDLVACYGSAYVRARRGERGDPDGLYGEWLDCSDEKGRVESVVFPAHGLEATLKPGSDVVEELRFVGRAALKQWWLVPCIGKAKG